MNHFKLVKISEPLKSAQKTLIHLHSKAVITLKKACVITLRSLLNSDKAPQIDRDSPRA